MKNRTLKIRTLLEIDEINQNFQPEKIIVVRIFGIPIFRFNRLYRSVVITEGGKSILVQ